MRTLYDKTGAAFSLDHEIDGTAYVRPMVKVFTQSGYGDDVHEYEDVEPANYLVAADRSDLRSATTFLASALRANSSSVLALMSALSATIGGASNSEERSTATR